MMAAGRPPLSFFDIRSKLWDLMDKFTVDQLADKLGVHRSTVYYWKTICGRELSGRVETSYDNTLHRNPNTEHVKRLVRLWQYHIRGY